MPRRRKSKMSIASANTISDESKKCENSNINDELPDAGLPKTKSFDVKGQKKTSVDFAVDVITQSGKFPGMGSIDQVHNATVTVDNTTRRRKTKAELKEHPDENLQTKKQHEIVEEKKKIAAFASGGARKKECAKVTNEAKRREIEAKKDAIDRAIMEDKLAKADLEKVDNIYKPEECLKYITIEMHPSLGSAWFMMDTAREMSEIGTNILHVDTTCPCGLLVWTRSVPPRLATDGGRIKLAPTKKLHPQSLLIVQGERLASLAEHVGSAHPHTRALILFANSKTIGCSLEEFSKKLQVLQIDWLMDLKMDVITVDSAMKLAKVIAHYTRAVAEAPYKKANRDIDEQAEFYMRGDNKNCVTVDKQGNGISRLWEQMLGVLPQSSLEVARALGAQYKTPQALVKDLRSPGGIDKVADLGVSRTNVPGARARRLGPEFSRKLHTLFSAENGDVVIE